MVSYWAIAHLFLTFQAMRCNVTWTTAMEIQASSILSSSIIPINVLFLIYVVECCNKWIICCDTNLNMVCTIIMFYDDDDAWVWYLCFYSILFLSMLNGWSHICRCLNYFFFSGFSRKWLANLPNACFGIFNISK